MMLEDFINPYIRLTNQKPKMFDPLHWTPHQIFARILIQNPLEFTFEILPSAHENIDESLRPKFQEGFNGLHGKLLLLLELHWITILGIQLKSIVSAQISSGWKENVTKDCCRRILVLSSGRQITENSCHLESIVFSLQKHPYTFSHSIGKCVWPCLWRCINNALIRGQSIQWEFKATTQVAICISACLNLFWRNRVFGASGVLHFHLKCNTFPYSIGIGWPHSLVHFTAVRNPLAIYFRTYPVISSFSILQPKTFSGSLGKLSWDFSSLMPYFRLNSAT